MQKNEYLKQWTPIVSKQMPHLSIPEVLGLATWSFGMVMTKSSSLSKVSQFIAVVNGEKASTVRQRLREKVARLKINLLHLALNNFPLITEFFLYLLI